MTQPDLGITPKVGYFHCSFFCKIIFVCLEAQSHPKGTISSGFTKGEKTRKEIKLSVGLAQEAGLGHCSTMAVPSPAQPDTGAPHSPTRSRDPNSCQGKTCPSSLGGTSAHVLRTYLGPSLTYQAPGVLVEWMVFSGAFNSVRCVCGCFNQQIDINRHLRLELFIRSWVPNFLRYF